MTISYDGRSNVMKHLIEAMLAAGAKLVPTGDTHVSHKQAVSPVLRNMIEQARMESASGETIVCSTVEEMNRYFGRL